MSQTVQPERQLRGLEKVCKIHGRMNCGGIMMAWDYANNCAVEERELRADKKRWEASERAKWKAIEELKKVKQ